MAKQLQVAESIRVNSESALNVVAQTLATLRKEAVEARNASGIEARWTYADDAYNGEDEATKGRTNLYKPSGPEAGFTIVPQSEWKRSTAFMNITRPYVDSSAARITDMLLSEDERNWELKLTPKLDTELDVTDIESLPPELIGKAMAFIEQQAEQTTTALADTQKQIDDWLTESHWTISCTDVINDAARIGSGVVKGPVPMMINGRMQPGSKVIKAQNCYPDGNCGDDIHNGEFFFEREEITKRKLRKKKKQARAGWLPEQIEACLEEGPKSYSGTTLTVNGKEQRNLFELWYYQGEVEAEALLECGCRVSGNSKTVWANATLCNDRVVRISVAPLADIFTYNVLRWQKRKDHWTGIGVGEQLETPQRGLNAAIRNIFDNAALSSLPQLVFWQGKLIPVNGRYEIEPGKVWKVDDSDGTVSFTDVKNAILTIEIPSKIPELTSVVTLMRNLAQETAGLPLVMQGMGSSGAVGTDQLQTNAGNTVLRRLAKEFDHRVTVPHLTNYYQWVKDFNVVKNLTEAAVVARGSSVLVERDIQAQALIQMVQLSANPIYGIDPELAMKEWVKSQKFDPKKVELSAVRKQELTAAESAPDEKAQATIKSSEIRAQALTTQAGMEAETDKLELQVKREDAELQRAHDKQMQDLQFKYKIIEYALQRGIDVKAAVAELNEVPDAA